MTTSRAPTPNPSSTLPQDKKTLDWGSDEEKYVFPSSLCTPYIKDHTVLAPLLKNIKGGTCNNTVDGSEVTQLYNMSIDAFDIVRCEHDVIFFQCAKCQMKMSSMWLLDSGASAPLLSIKMTSLNICPSVNLKDYL